MANQFTYHAHGLLEIFDIQNNGGWSFFKATRGGLYGGQTALIAATPEEAKTRYETYLRDQIVRAEESIRHAQGCRQNWQENLDRLLS